MILMVVCTLSFLVSSALAADDIPSIYINGKEFKSNNAPFIKDGTTLVPLRDILESYKLDVEWLSEYNGIRINTASKVILMKPDFQTVISFDISEENLSIFGEDEYGVQFSSFKRIIGTLNQPLIVINGITYIPLRFLSEIIDLNVRYDSINNDIYIEGNLTKTETYEKQLGNIWDYDRVLQMEHNDEYNDFQKQVNDNININLSSQAFDIFEDNLRGYSWIIGRGTTRGISTSVINKSTNDVVTLKNLTKIQIASIEEISKYRKDDIHRVNFIYNNDYYFTDLSDINSRFNYLFIGTNPYEKYNWSQKVWDSIQKEQIFIDMNNDMVIMSWGKPKDINRTIGSWGVHEQWVYPYNNYLYFENGKLTSAQN